MTRVGGSLILVASVSMSSLAHFFLKLGAIRIRWDRSATFLTNVGSIAGIPTLWLGVALHGCALIIWVYALSTMELGFAYPFLALGYALILVLSIVFLGESWNLMRIGGMALIVTGVILVART